MSPPPSRALYVDAEPGAVFGFLHEPEPGTARGPAVLICPPYGWDDVGTYRPRRDWADHLAARGHPVLRFDFPGAGDSEGGPRDPRRVEAWTAAVAAAAAELRALSGLSRVVAIGVGLGGLIALRAAVGGAQVDDFVLWGVPARGKTLLRELRAFARLEETETSTPPEPAGVSVPEGGVEAAGFLMTPETVADLEALDFTSLTLPEAGERRALLLTREKIDVDKRLVGHLGNQGVQVSVQKGPGYSLFMEEPQLARPPLRVFEAVDAWLAQGGRDEPEGGQVEAAATFEDAGVRERPFTVEREGGRLFGVLAEPVEAPRADLCAVILNPGAIRRIGSGRMWVEIARRWAARGVPTLRLDLAGIGDSDGDAQRYADTGALYVQELVPQVIEAMDELERQGAPRRFLLMGLCSGAYWSFHVALRDERVVAAYLLNVRALFWDRSLAAVRDARKARWALEGSRWRRLLTGKVPLKELLRVVRATLAAPFTLTRRALESRRQRRELESAFDRLRDAGQRLLLVFGEDEPVMDELERDGYVGELERWPNTELRQLPGNSHTFRPMRAQRRVHELLDAELERELPGASPAVPARVPG